MPGRFDGRCAVVTGAAQGLGRAVAARLLREGASVVAADVQGDKVAAMRAALGEPASRRMTTVSGDLSIAAGARALIDTALGTFGRLDVLVNVAGGSGHEAIRDIEDMREEVWHQVFANNIHATYQCCRAAVPHMRKAAYGRIVNFTSGAVDGFTAWPTAMAARLAYSSAKGAIEAFTRQLAADLYPAGITVNMISPSFVLTEPGARVYERFNQLPDEIRNARIAGGDLKTTPEDIADASAYLASEGAGAVHGMCLKVGCR